jgi:hypothetical protein
MGPTAGSILDPGRRTALLVAPSTVEALRDVHRAGSADDQTLRRRLGPEAMSTLIDLGVLRRSEASRWISDSSRWTVDPHAMADALERLLLG